MKKTTEEVDEEQQDGLGSLYMATFLDSLGTFMFAPLVSFLARELHATDEQISILAAVYAGAQFIFTPLLGRLSDVVGRKKVVLVTMGGSSFSLFLTAYVRTPYELIIVRMLNGAFASTVGICEAIVADRSTEENRAASISKIQAFFSVGMSLGPAVGGWIGQLGFRTLCLTASAITAFNVWWLYIQLPYDEVDQVDLEERAEQVKAVNAGELDVKDVPFAKIAPSFEETLIVVTTPRALMLFFLTFIQTAYSGVFLGIGAVYFMDIFDFQQFKFSEGTTVMSLSVFLFQMFLTGPAVRVLGEGGSTIVGNIIRAISSLLVIASHSQFTPWSVFVLMAVTQALIDPSMASMVAGISGEENRGSVMGVYQSMRSLGEVFGPVVAGQMYSKGKNLPILFQFVLAILSCLVPRQVGKTLAGMGALSLTKKAPRPWKRLLYIFVALFICSGLSPGMMVWVDQLASYKVLFGLCDSQGYIQGINPPIPDPFFCDRQYSGMIVPFVAGNLVGSISLLPMLSWLDQYGTSTISTIGGCLCASGYLILMLALWMSFLNLPTMVVSVFLFIAASVSDAGAKLAATALQGFAWHFDGSRIVVFLIAMVIYGLAGLIPLLLTGFMALLGLTNPFHPFFFMTCLVSGGTVILRLHTPSREEYHAVAYDVLGVSLDQFSTPITAAKAVGSANKLLRKNAPRHFFFVIVCVFVLTWITLYQGFTGNYGLDLFLDVKKDLSQGKLPDFHVGRELVVMVMVGTTFSGSMFSIVGVVLTELYGWVAILSMMAVLHLLTLTTIGTVGWGGQFFTAALASVCREMVIIIQGKYLSCWAPPTKLASVTCLMNCYIALGTMVFVYFTSNALLGALGKREVYLILVGVAGLWVVGYAAFCSIVQLPRSPVLLREEERELCESYGCSNLQEVLTVMGFDDREAVLQLLSSSDPEVQGALMMSIKVDLLEENLYQQSLSSLVSMLRRGFAWTQGSTSLANRRMLSGSPGSFAITPHLWSQFWKKQVDAEMFNSAHMVENDLDGPVQITGGVSKKQKTEDLERIVRTSQTVLTRITVVTHQSGNNGNENGTKRFLVQMSEEFPDGKKIQRKILPTTRRSDVESIQECTKRNLQKYGLGGLKIKVDYEHVEVVEEPYEYPTYPGVITMYRKEIVSCVVEEKDLDTLAKIALPWGGDWTTKDEARVVRKAKWMTEAEIKSNNVVLDGKSQLLTDLKEQREASKKPKLEPEEKKVTEVEKQGLHLAEVMRKTGGIIKSFEARKYSKNLVKHLRSRNRAALMQWLRSEIADGVCDAFEDLEDWVQAESKSLMKIFSELLNREDLVELLKKRTQLKRMVIFIMKYELMIFQRENRIEVRSA